MLFSSFTASGLQLHDSAKRVKSGILSSKWLAWDGFTVHAQAEACQV